jgi:hypothetical protein
MTKLAPIWPKDTEIEVIGVTGKFSSGKSLFGLQIDPKHTKVYDFEKSCGTYKNMGFERVDVPAIMLSLYQRDQYTPVNVFEWWLNDIRKIKPGQYSVIMADTIGDIEAGLPGYVKTLHAQYGFKTPAAFESMGGVFWNAVKEFWKSVLSDLAARCQTFVFTAHLKKKWVGGKQTRDEEPKGKATMMELASLYLWMEREKEVPAGEVIKSRLAITGTNDEGGMVIHPLLPPRIPVCTPDAIRKYILTPPDYKHLKKSEKVIEPVMTEDDKLMVESQIAEDRKDAETTALQRLEKQAEIQQMLRKGSEERQQLPDKTAQVKKDQAQAAVAHAESNGDTIDAGKASMLIAGVRRSGFTPEQLLNVIEGMVGERNILKLTNNQAKDIVNRIREKTFNPDVPF